ncbi:MAG: type II toxin-antitoxin system VapC family toxin [Cyanobacteria bacterium CRU_2_1]|nr:type II toxin-antitoxin system VapC family toxin [Cyanobacteria bacterium RU_5_0]NJR59872.1 type II toxin-antitoxin system VapC family toxin [Cyanobacteria bacterium CRU_2_1]
MKQVFVDTFYWVALLNPRDDLHQEIFQFSQTITTVLRVTTEEVLIEVLNFFSNYDALMRQKASRFTHRISNELSIHIIQQTHASFQSGLELYERRLDKGYSLTDCISMQTVKQLGITDILTRDRHFTQEGFNILLSK